MANKRFESDAPHFGRVFDRLMLKLDSNAKSRHKSQFCWLIKYGQRGPEASGYRIVKAAIFQGKVEEL